MTAPTLREELEALRNWIEYIHGHVGAFEILSQLDAILAKHPESVAPSREERRESILHYLGEVYDDSNLDELADRILDTAIEAPGGPIPPSPATNYTKEVPMPSEAECRERERRAFVRGRAVWPCDKCGGPMAATGYVGRDRCVILFCAPCNCQKTIEHNAWLNLPTAEVEALRCYPDKEIPHAD